MSTTQTLPTSVRSSYATASNIGNPDAGFPLNLLRNPYAGESGPSASFRLGHNRAVLAFAEGGRDLRRCERRILGLMQGIETYVGASDSFDGYNVPHVIYPLLDAQGDALSEDLGRLDGATLSAWAVWTAEERCGFSLDTGEFFRYVIRKDGETVERCTSHDAAFMRLQRLQGQSFLWATEFGGWSVDPIND